MNGELPGREITEDTALGGRIRVRQFRSGYRFSIDAVLLAHEAARRPGESVVDLGTGCGIISLIIGYLRPQRRICGVEYDTGSVRLARENIKSNQMADRITILEGDIRRLRRQDLGPDMTPDLLVSNPPFRPVNAGRINPDTRRAAARHELTLTLADLAAAARRLLNKNGRFLVIYPAWRCAELLAALSNQDLAPKRLRPVYSRPEARDARLLLVEAVRSGRPGLEFLRPLYLHEGRTPDETGKNGRPDYSAEVARMLEPAREAESAGLR
ncbi:MAG: methyltransferase [Desulfobacterales bacterium]|nr:MAG: methyltransferase [Desulfobacterales bacterium]